MQTTHTCQSGEAECLAGLTDHLPGLVLGIQLIFRPRPQVLHAFEPQPSLDPADHVVRTGGAVSRAERELEREGRCVGRGRGGGRCGGVVDFLDEPLQFDGGGADDEEGEVARRRELRGR
jgi:hypothetical protein